MNTVIDLLSGRPIHGTLTSAGSETSSIVLMFHGIFVDRSENGRFDRLAPLLADRGLDSLRVDLAGHGESAVPSFDARIASMATEILDVLAWARSEAGYSQVFVVASSFSGALATLAFTSPVPPSLLPDRLVMLNPVLDFRNAFTHAEMPEMAEMFSGEAQREAFERGSFDPTESFRMSREFLIELERIDVSTAYAELGVAHLVLHGTADELISFGRTKELATANAAAHFEPIEGGVHAFTQSGHEPTAWDRVISWFTQG